MCSKSCETKQYRSPEIPAQRGGTGEALTEQVPFEIYE